MTLLLAVVAVGILLYGKKQNPKQSPQELRMQRDISEIRKFAGSANLAVQFESESKSSNGLNVPVNIYYSGADRYEIDANGKIVEFSSRNLPIGSENEKVINNDPRYSQQDLENMARQFIIKNASEVGLEKLTLDQNIKESGSIKNYFFRWEDKARKTTEGYPFIQVGFSQGGTLLNYVDTL